jgi:hypothetical protein
MASNPSLPMAMKYLKPEFGVLALFIFIWHDIMSALFYIGRAI